MDSEKVIKGLEKLLYCHETRCEDCIFAVKEPCKPSTCVLAENEIIENALELIKKQQKQIEALKQTAQNMMEGIVVFRG